MTNVFSSPVHDATSYAQATQTASNTLDTAKGVNETVKGITEVSETLTSALHTANKSLSELSTMNSVLGRPLSSSILGKISSIHGTSRKYGGLLNALNNVMSGKSSGYDLNYAAHSTLGTPNVSRFLSAKSYFARKYYQMKGDKYEYKQAKAIRVARDRAARNSVVTSMAVAKAHKEDLRDDHNDLESISREAAKSGDMNHQILFQTKLLERIAQTLEKIVLLQSQQLDFMAKTYLGEQEVDPRDLRLNERETK